MSAPSPVPASSSPLFSPPPSLASSARAASPPLTSGSVLLSFDDPCESRVEEAGQNHFERFVPSLSSVERFYVQVAHSFAQEEVDRRRRQDADDADDDRKRRARAGAGKREEDVVKTQERLQAVAQHLRRARQTLETFTSTLESVVNKRDIGIALSFPDNGTQTQQQQQPSSPPSPTFALTRRNRLAVLIASHSSHLSSASSLLQSGGESLRQSLRLQHLFIDQLQLLSRHWLIRHRAATTSSVLPPLMVELSMEDIGAATAGSRLRLSRDDRGRAALDPQVGLRSQREDEEWKQRRRRRRDRQRQRAVAAADSSNPPLSLSSSDNGWLATSSRLHRAQRQLLHQHLHSLLLAEAKRFSSPLCSVSVLQSVITIESASFPTVWLDWDEGAAHCFTVRVSSRRLQRALDSRSLFLSLLQPLLSHYVAHAASNRPPLLSSLSTPFSPLSSPPAPPALLSSLIHSVYHLHLALSIRRMLPELLLPHPGVRLSFPLTSSPLSLTFSLHRADRFLLHCTVHEMSITVVMRGSVKAELRSLGLSAAGLEEAEAAAGGELWAGNAAANIELLRCQSLSQLRDCITFAVQQPMHS